MPTHRSAAEILSAVFDGLSRLDTAAVVELMHDELYFELPFERGPALDKAGFGRMVSWIVASFQRFDLELVEVIETADPQRLVARYDGDCLSKDGSVSYRNNYIAVLTVTDGLVSHWLEYANPVLTRRVNEQLSATSAER